MFDDTVNMAKQARFAMEFCAIESCGKCTPCRVGSTRGVEVIDRIISNTEPAVNLVVLEDLYTMKFGSLGALGGFTPYPVMSALIHFAEDFGAAPRRLQAAESRKNSCRVGGDGPEGRLHRGPLIVAISAPTALATRTTKSAGITLIAIARGDGFEVFPHPERITAARIAYVARK